MRVFQDHDRVCEEDDLSFYVINEWVYGYEDDVLENVESSDHLSLRLECIHAAFTYNFLANSS